MAWAARHCAASRYSSAFASWENRRFLNLTPRRAHYDRHTGIHLLPAAAFSSPCWTCVGHRVGGGRCFGRFPAAYGRRPADVCADAVFSHVGLAVLYSGRQPDDERRAGPQRSEEHTSELQSLMRISYAVFCLKKKTKHTSMI